MAGTVKANRVQLGDAATVANNFVLQTNNNGSMKLARGNVGATTQDILTVDLSGVVGGHVVGTEGNQTIAGTKTFSSPIAGSVTGSAGSVTNGVYTTGDQEIGGSKSFTHPTSIVGSNLQMKRADSTAAAQYIGYYNDGSMALDAYIGYGGTGKNFQLTNSVGSINLSATLFGVACAISCDQNITAYSDERVKTNWRGLGSGFVELLSMVKSGVYDRTDIELTQVGVSAQSLRTVMPHAVLEDSDGKLSVAYGNAALAACIELAKEVVELRRRLELLEG